MIKQWGWKKFSESQERGLCLEFSEILINEYANKPKDSIRKEHTGGYIQRGSSSPCTVKGRLFIQKCFIDTALHHSGRLCILLREFCFPRLSSFRVLLELSTSHWDYFGEAGQPSPKDGRLAKGGPRALGPGCSSEANSISISVKLNVFLSLAAITKYQKLRGLRQQLFSHSLEARCLKPSHQLGHASYGTLGGILPCLFPASRGSANPCPSQTASHITPTSVPAVTYFFTLPSHKVTTEIRLRVYPTAYDLILTNYICNDPISKQSCWKLGLQCVWET
jgi:hypothetical protein